MKKSEATRAKILECALQLFRKRGFDETTMRDIAEEAGLALGAAYYYFPSKEALLLAYYAKNQADHEARVVEKLSGTLREKLGVLMHEKLEAVKRERKLLGAIVQRLANPADPISAFAKETKDVREESMALFARALEGEPLSDELKKLVTPALWMLHMGFMLYFIHDSSAKQEKTHRLVDDMLDLVVPLVYLGTSAQTAPLVTQLGRALMNAGLVEK
jgi:AcrR family transcriptional regulator